MNKPLQFKDVAHLYLWCDCLLEGRYKAKLCGFQHNKPILTLYYASGEVSYSQKDTFALNDYSLLKPILRPLSDMTKEEGIEYAQFYCRNKIAVPIDWVEIKMHESGSVNLSIGDGGGGLSLFPGGPHGDKAEAFVYLLKKGFDLFGLIESGQALDKTKM